MIASARWPTASGRKWPRRSSVSPTRSISCWSALFSGGHILLEGPPGTAKTLLAQCFARSLDLKFGRIQFTPDLMPGDIVGTNLFNFQTSAFTLTKGPIFCDVLLADEINRTPPKTQAALLEAMQERRVTLDGQSHLLGDRFMVVATQNPIEQQGTYPLPEAQLDRFLFKQRSPIRAKPRSARSSPRTDSASACPIPRSSDCRLSAGAHDLAAAIDAISAVKLNEAIVDYVVALVRATRESGDIAYGASPRAAAMIATAARARAALEGRDYVIPDDVKALTLPALAPSRRAFARRRNRRTPCG